MIFYMNIERLFKITEISWSEDKSELRAVIELNEEHDIFKGHFPGNPVLPGVCHLEIVGDLLYEAFGIKYRLKIAKNIKFLNFINPLVQKSLSYHLEISDFGGDKSIIASSYFADDIINFKLSGTFTEL